MNTTQLSFKKTRLFPLNFVFKFPVFLFVFLIIAVSGFAQPSITSFSPLSAPVGTTVTITGNNFSTNATENIVYFGAVKATVTAASTTSLSVTVPAGATYHPISVTTNKLADYSSLPFIVIFSNQGSNISSTSFTAPTSISTGSNFNRMFLNDLDGDGKADVICGAGGFAGNGGAKAFLNTSTAGNISFNSGTDFTVGSRAWDFSIGDLDGDGKTDIATLDFSANKISILKNTSTIGTISFQLITDLSVGTDNSHVLIADLNSDGKPDILSSNQTDRTVTVFENTTTTGISFATAVYMDGGASVGDYNNDGKLDMSKAGNYLSDNVWIFKNTGTAGAFSFDTSKNLATTDDPRDAMPVDLDGDGLLDVVSTISVLNSVSVFKNLSTGEDIEFSEKTDFTTSTSPVTVLACDLNGDGRPDIVTQNSSAADKITVMQNTSSSSAISFSAPIDYSTSAVGGWGFSLGDVDGDGKPEMVVCNFNSASFSVFQNLTETTLPLSSINLSVTNLNGKAQLKWKVFNEVNVLQYMVQYSTDGTTFKDIAKVKAIGGNDYSFTHQNPASGPNYYRIKVLDNDGKFLFSRIEKIDLGNSLVKISVYPNPATSFLIVTHPSGITKSTITIIDVNGHAAKRVNVEPGVIETRMDINNLAKGNYIVKWSNGTDTQYRSLIIQ